MLETAGPGWPAAEYVGMLSVKDLCRPGLAPVTVEVGAGECVAVMGPSGSGKSLLLRAIADLDPNRGRVTLDGCPRERLSGPEWRRRVRYVAAEPGWWGETVGAHLPDREAAGPLLEALRLPAEAIDWPVARLSSGESQRLALARALLDHPAVLLLDEPTRALDAGATEAVEGLLRRELERKVAILLVTHDAEQARRLARRRLEVVEGRVTEPAT